MTPHRNHTQRPLRSGFTLLEVLITIIIISALMSLLLTAIGPSKNKGYETEVRVEISKLEKAISDFNLSYGSRPPSRIVLYEEEAGWMADNRSRAIIRGMWGEFDFGLDRDLDHDGTPGETDPDGDGTDGITLTGAECLVFFLGGVVAGSSGAPFISAPNGFSKNPADPFATGGSRTGPFFEFEGFYIDEDADDDATLDAGEDINTNGRLDVGWGGRFVNVLNAPMSLPEKQSQAIGAEYLDSFPGQTKPYWYASSYEGQAYLTDDLAGSGMSDVYRQTGGTDPIAWKSKSFQIISPGADAQYGVGGRFTAETAQSDLTGTRADERDNITNFNGGSLAP